MTGIPSHGGGKRFAVEQELISATARAVAKDLDVSALQGKRVAIYMVGIGDEGSGNLTGGRYFVEALVRGGDVDTPNSRYPMETTRTTTGNAVTVAENALNAPIDSKGSDRQLTAIGGNSIPGNWWISRRSLRQSGRLSASQRGTARIARIAWGIGSRTRTSADRCVFYGRCVWHRSTQDGLPHHEPGGIARQDRSRDDGHRPNHGRHRHPPSDVEFRS